MNTLDHDVILASLKLARAMRRCPPERGESPFPPAVGRLLACAAENPGISPRELCELRDVRPSSLSEMLARAEADSLLTRAVDEADKRIQRITLSEKGSRLISELKAARDEDARKKTSCLTEEEKITFCDLCEKLSAHIESLALELPEGMEPPPGPEFPHPGPEPDGPRPFPPRGPRFRC